MVVRVRVAVVFRCEFLPQQQPPEKVVFLAVEVGSTTVAKLPMLVMPLVEQVVLERVVERLVENVLLAKLLA
jgi:hypothetical protein